jgi:hypothetical protein
LDMSGVVISFMTLTSAARATSFVACFFIEYPDHINTEPIQLDVIRLRTIRKRCPQDCWDYSYESVPKWTDHASSSEYSGFAHSKGFARGDSVEFPARSPTPANRSRTQDSVNQHHFLLVGVLRASRPVTVHLNEAPFVGMELEAGSDWSGIKPGTRLRVTYMRLHVEQPTQSFPRSMLHVVAV